jgi:hypothetical protein
MIKIVFRLLCAVVMLSSICVAQVQPCPSGTLADVAGSTCSIGQITFTFGTNFTGFSENVVSGVNTVKFLTPQDIGFVPVIAANQTGFQLITNFSENPNGPSNVSVSDALFSYGFSASDTSEIVSETVTINGTITQVSSDSIFAIDRHVLPNQFFFQVEPTESFSTSSSLVNQPTATSAISPPAITAEDLNPLGFIATTELNATAFDGDVASLASATFLFTTASRVPTPAAGNFRFRNADLPGVPVTFAGGINDRGQIAGAYQDSSGLIHGYLADGDDFTTIDFPGATETVATASNNSGTVVGTYADATGQFHGFTLKDGAFTSIDFPGAIFLSVIDINEEGTLVGVYEIGPSVHGFTQDKDGFTTIDDPANAFLVPFTQAVGINDRKEVIGTFADAESNAHGFALVRGIFTQIDVPGAGTSFPEGLNNQGDIVGAYDDLEGIQHGYLERGDSFSTLDFPGAAAGSTILFQINARGIMVGNYVDDQGVTHSFTAIQQPSSPHGQGQDAAVAQAGPKARSKDCGPADWDGHPERRMHPKACGSGK